MLVLLVWMQSLSVKAIEIFSCLDCFEVIEIIWVLKTLWRCNVSFALYKQRCIWSSQTTECHGSPYPHLLGASSCTACPIGSYVGTTGTNFIKKLDNFTLGQVKKKLQFNSLFIQCSSAGASACLSCPEGFSSGEKALMKFALLGRNAHSDILSYCSNFTV